MKTKLSPVFIIVFICCVAGGAQAQDAMYSQPFANPLYLNPAFAGLANSQRLGLNGNSELGWLPIGYATMNVFYDRNIIDSNWGIGVIANYNHAGSNEGYYYSTNNNTENIDLVLSRRFHIKKSFYISVGVEAGFIREIQSIAVPRIFIYPHYWNSYDYADTTNTIINALDYSAGILGYSKHYFFSFAVNHLTQPEENFPELGNNSRLPARYTFTTGAMIPVKGVTITPVLTWYHQYEYYQPYQYNNYFNQFTFECYLSAGHFTGAMGLQYGQYIVPDYSESGIAPPIPTIANEVFLFAYQNDRVRIGLSFTLILSPTSLFYYNQFLSYNYGTCELSMTYLLPYKSPKLKKSTGFNCLAY